MTEREERLRNALRAEDDLIKALQRRVEYYMCHPSHKDVLIGDLRQIFIGQSAIHAQALADDALSEPRHRNTALDAILRLARHPDGAQLTSDDLREWIDEHTRAPWITVERKHPQNVHGEMLLSLLSELLVLRERVTKLEAALDQARPFVEAETDEDLYAELGGSHASEWQERGREAYRALAAIDISLDRLSNDLPLQGER
jgi:hypothetical protein